MVIKETHGLKVSFLSEFIIAILEWWIDKISDITTSLMYAINFL